MPIMCEDQIRHLRCKPVRSSRVGQLSPMGMPEEAAWWHNPDHCLLRRVLSCNQLSPSHWKPVQQQIREVTILISWYAKQTLECSWCFQGSADRVRNSEPTSFQLDFLTYLSTLSVPSHALPSFASESGNWLYSFWISHLSISLIFILLNSYVIAN